MEITQKSAPQSVEKPLGFFKERPNVRKHYSQESLRELNGSMKTHGQLLPVIALLSGLLICGYRRLYAARLGGIETLRAYLVADELDAGRIHVMQGVENIQRENLSEVETWEMLVGHKVFFPTHLNKDIAAEYGKDACWVTRYLAPSKTTPEWQKAFRDGLVGIASVYEASKASEHQQREMLRMKLEGATRDQLQKSVRKARPKGADPVSSSTVTIPLPSGVRVVVKGKRMTLAEVHECLIACVDAAKRGLKDKLSVKSWASVLRDQNKEAASV
jgi:ParB/RepB/Spo0J family partition protein